LCEAGPRVCFDVVTRSGFTPARFWFFQGLAHEKTSEGVQVLLLAQPCSRLVAVAPASGERHTWLSEQECIYHAFIFYYSCPGPSNKVDCSFCCTAFNRRFLEALRRSSTILRMDGAGGSISGIGACSVSSVFLTWSPT